MRRAAKWMVGAVVFLAAGAAVLHATHWSQPLLGIVRGKKTVEDRLAEYGPAARSRWQPSFERAGASYPPAAVVLLGLKAEKRLEVYAGAAPKAMRLVRSYPILAASGVAGPKLRRGDRQVPEGLYGIEALNPNSRFHLALRVNYPNGFDREMSAADGRTDLGSDIMIHLSQDMQAPVSPPPRPIPSPYR